MNALLIPILQALRELSGDGGFFLGVEFLNEEPKLLAEMLKRLEPVVSAVLVAVSNEE